MKNVAANLARELGRRHEVMYTSVLTALHDPLSKAISRFQPHVIHFIPGATVASFTILKLLKAFQQRTLTVLSILVPRFQHVPTALLGALRPDAIIVQSPRMLQLSNVLRIPCRFIPNGVDLDRFTPRTSGERKRLRAKYGLDFEGCIVLHVGHIQSGRNLRALQRLSGTDRKVVVVGTTSTKPDTKLLRELARHGVVVLRSYFERIEELYGLSDCYVFPTLDERRCAGVPLSVLEAMSCNLSVVSTRFGGLVLLFEEGDGLLFANNPDELPGKVTAAQKIVEVATRQKVLDYGWTRAARDTEEFYEELLS